MKQVTQQITEPVRGSPNFSDAADAFASQLNPYAQQLNEVAQEVSTGAAIVGNGLPMIVASANFKGLWTSLVGALACPASCYHANQFWQLTENVANVTTEVPGVSAKWKSFKLITRPSVQTNEVVPDGALVAADTVTGASMAVAAVAPVTVAAVSADTVSTFAMTGDNVGIVFRVGTDLRMMIVDKNKNIVQASVSIGTCGSCYPRGTQLSNGNIAVSYLTASNFPSFKVVTQAGAPVVAETTPEAVAVGGVNPMILGLVGGGFVFLFTQSANVKRAIYTNTGGVTTAVASLYGGSTTAISLCKQSNGGYALGYFISGTGYLLGGYSATGASQWSYTKNVTALAEANSIVESNDNLFFASFNVTLGLVFSCANKNASFLSYAPQFAPLDSSDFRLHYDSLV